LMVSFQSVERSSPTGSVDSVSKKSAKSVGHLRRWPTARKSPDHAQDRRGMFGGSRYVPRTQNVPRAPQRTAKVLFG
jgi:hypothetical protein